MLIFGVKWFGAISISSLSLFFPNLNNDARIAFTSNLPHKSTIFVCTCNDKPAFTRVFWARFQMTYIDDQVELIFCDILSLRAELFVLVFHQFVINKYTSRVDKVSGVEFKFFFIFLLTNRRRIVSLSLARRFIINTLNWTHFIHS